MTIFYKTATVYDIIADIRRLAALSEQFVDTIQIIRDYGITKVTTSYCKWNLIDSIEELEKALTEEGYEQNENGIFVLKGCYLQRYFSDSADPIQYDPFWKSHLDKLSMKELWEMHVLEIQAHFRDDVRRNVQIAIEAAKSATTVVYEGKRIFANQEEVDLMWWDDRCDLALFQKELNKALKGMGFTLTKYGFTHNYVRGVYVR